MSTPNLFSDPGQPASATKASPPDGFPTLAEVEAWHAQWQSVEEVLGDCQRLGLKGKCMDPAKCLLAQLCRNRFPVFDIIVDQSNLYFYDSKWLPGLRATITLRTNSVFRDLITLFDKRSLPAEFYDS